MSWTQRVQPRWLHTVDAGTEDPRHLEETYFDASLNEEHSCAKYATHQGEDAAFRLIGHIEECRPQAINVQEAQIQLASL